MTRIEDFRIFCVFWLPFKALQFVSYFHHPGWIGSSCKYLLKFLGNIKSPLPCSYPYMVKNTHTLSGREETLVGNCGGGLRELMASLGVDGAGTRTRMFYVSILGRHKKEFQVVDSWGVQHPALLPFVTSQLL